jgi:hypothetical protein
LLEVWKFGSLEGFTWEAGDVRAWDSLDFLGEDGDPDRARGLPNAFQTSKLPVHPAASSSPRKGPRPPPVPAPSPDWKSRRCGRRVARLIAGSLEVWKASPGKRAMFGLGAHWIFSMERTEIRIEPEVSPMPSKLPNFPFTQQHHQATAMARGPHRLLPPARIGSLPNFPLPKNHRPPSDGPLSPQVLDQDLHP